MIKTVYLVGAGNIARTHVEAVSRLGNDEPASIKVADINDKTLRNFVDIFPRATPYSDLESMLSEPTNAGDIVVVATPPKSHPEITVHALESGRPVLCEKPLATDLEQAERMRDVAERTGLLLGSCACRFLGTPHTSRVKQRLEENDLGDLYHVSIIDRDRRNRTGVEYQPETEWYLDSSVGGGGVLMDFGIYDITLLNHLLAPESVTVEHAWTAEPRTEAGPSPSDSGVEQHGGATLEYELPTGDAVPITYERAACTHGAERTVFEIEGMQGAINWNWKEMAAPVRYSTDAEGDVVDRTETFAYNLNRRLSATERPLVFFEQALAGNSAPIATGDEALFNFSCLRAIYETASTDRRVTIRREDV